MHRIWLAGELASWLWAIRAPPKPLSLSGVDVDGSPLSTGLQTPADTLPTEALSACETVPHATSAGIPGQPNGKREEPDQCGERTARSRKTVTCMLEA